jgi:small subunit ribosomal protein S1
VKYHIESKVFKVTDENKNDKRGPMVVVKRAGAMVETKAEAKAVEPLPVAAEVAPLEVTPREAQKPLIVKHAAPAGPSVADEVKEAETFADMFEKSAKDGGLPTRKGMPRIGEKVKGKIFQLGAQTAFLTIGRLEAMIDIDELKDAEGILRSGVGDEVEAHVMETGAKGIMLSKKLSRGAVSMSLLAEAKMSGMPVEGIVLAVNKGGLEVAVGESRAFCPTSQVDVRPVKLEDFIGQRMAFRITEIKDKNVVLSRRALLEEENKVKGAELKKSLAVGGVLKGHVTSVQTFGAFVDLGGLEGLIPVSELSHVRIGHPNEVVNPGDLVEVEIIRMEDGQPNSPDKTKRKDRLTLSMRSRMEDPFKKALETIQEGSTVKGKVVRLQPFGAFVELTPGVDGLIHISAMSERRIAHPRDALKVGDEIEAKVEKIDLTEKRIGLRLMKDGVAVGEGVSTSSAPAAHEAPRAQAETDRAPRAAKPRRGQIVTGKVNRIEPFGIFIEWDGNVGMVPASETGTERGTDLKRVFPMGKEVKAEVIEIAGEKLKLSLVQAQRTEERADLDAWKKEQSSKVTSSGGFNSLADKLRAFTQQK